MIYITGDTHRELDINKLSVNNFPKQKEMTRDDFLIIAGDFGGVWYGGGKDKRFMAYQYGSKNFTTLFIDGNHENFDALNSYDVEEWNGGKVHRVTDNVIHLMRGQVYKIDSKKIFTMGGALSIDKSIRTEGISWWPEELPSFAETDEALSNLEKAGWEVDYIVTHACPGSLKPILFSRKYLRPVNDTAESFLDEVYRRLHFKRWYCGHYHIDKEIKGTNIRVLYQDVVKAGE